MCSWTWKRRKVGGRANNRHVSRELTLGTSCGFESQQSGRRRSSSRREREYDNTTLDISR